MNSIDSQMPEVRIARLEEELEDLREENASLTRERDEARAAIVAALDEFTATKVLKLRVEELTAEVARLEGLILAHEHAYEHEMPNIASQTEDALLAEARRIRGLR